MQRLKFASKVASIHFLTSLFIAFLLALLVFFVWYPYPLRSVTGSFQLFWLLISVDVICGPLLTLLLSNPKKSRREMFLDLGLIITIQLSAFLYGIYHVYEARPVVVVFEVDRLRVLTPIDIATNELPNAPEQYRTLPLFGHFLLSTREAKDGDDKLDAIEKSLTGLDIGQRPSWWLPYSDNISTIKDRAIPIHEFINLLPKESKTLLEKYIDNMDIPSKDLYCLPLTSAHSSDWTAILNANMELVNTAPINGFITKN